MTPAFHSWAEFFAMGNYAFYVWLAVAATLLSLLGLLMHTLWQHKQLLADITAVRLGNNVFVRRSLTRHRCIKYRCIKHHYIKHRYNKHPSTSPIYRRSDREPT